MLLRIVGSEDDDDNDESILVIMAMMRMPDVIEDWCW